MVIIYCRAKYKENNNILLGQVHDNNMLLGKHDRIILLGQMYINNILLDQVLDISVLLGQVYDNTARPRT